MPPLLTRPRARPDVLAPTPGTAMPDGTVLTGCMVAAGDDRPWLRDGDRASSVDDDGTVVLWRWSPRAGWKVQTDG